jgi:hypothetical protein
MKCSEGYIFRLLTIYIYMQVFVFDMSFYCQRDLFLFSQGLDYKKNIECMKVRLGDFSLVTWRILLQGELIVPLLVIIPNIL